MPSDSKQKTVRVCACVCVFECETQTGWECACVTVCKTRQKGGRKNKRKPSIGGGGKFQYIFTIAGCL